MNSEMAAFILCLGGLSTLICGIKGIGEEVGAKSDLKDKSPFSIEHIESSPEVLVQVPGIEKPICFNVGTREETVRVLQDPKTGVVVNAQISYDNLNNKTYIGAVLVAQGNICLLATQLAIWVNNARFKWGDGRVLNIDGHRVIISEDMVMVKVRQCRITLVIQRHCTAQENSMDYSELGVEIPSRPTADNVSESDSKEVSESENRPAILPVIGYAESESFINHFLSSKRRRGLLLQKFFGINQDSAVVRNVLIEVDSEGRKKRDKVTKDSVPPHDELVLDQDDAHEYQQPQQSSQSHNDKDPFLVHQQRQQHQNVHPRRYIFERQQRGYNEESRMDREAEKRRDSTIFLDMYIAESVDFSNRTHGLLGQFLFKNVTREKIRYKDGKMTARLLIQENPIRRTNALFTSRFYTATNETRECWKIRHQGRDVLDGKYSDYVVPSIWFRNLKELPPPAPL